MDVSALLCAPHSPTCRAASGKRDADVRQLSGALSQLEVAEAALRDSQGTATRLLQDCTNLQRHNRQLSDDERQLSEQLHGALYARPSCAALLPSPQPTTWVPGL